MKLAPLLHSITHPVRTYHRWQSRRSLKLFQRYHAAQFDRLTGNWFSFGQNHNMLVASASPVLRNRVRDLVRNFPPFTRAVNSLTGFVVGRGSRFQSLALKPDGTEDLKARRKIEDRFRAWMDQADVAGKLHFYEMQQLAQRQIMESGEFFARFVKPRGRNRHPFALQVHEAEALTSYNITALANDTDIYQGVEYDTLTGEVIAYHLQQEPGINKELRSWREEAGNCIHLFNTLRPGQLRGVTPFASAILLAKDMADYTEAEIDAAKLAAKWLAFIKTGTDPHIFQAARGLNPNQTSSPSPPIEELENAITEYLRPGEEIQFAPSPGRPGDSFDRFTRFVLRMVSISIDVPYEILSGDYTGINYSTSKASRNDFTMLLAPHRFRIEQHLVRRVFNRFLDFEALTQDYLPGYWANPARYRAAMWIPAGMPSVDPLRDGKADIDAIAAKIKSPQQVIMAAGGDPEETVLQLAAWQELCARHGVDPNPSHVDTALANNPAKLGAIETDPDGGY